MKLVTFDEGEGPLTGVVEGDTILPLRDTVEMVELIKRGAGWAPAGPGLPLHSVRLLAPIVPKRNVFCVGWNYSEHFAEGKEFRGPTASQEIPEHPALFS
jgi:2-keto-4-pentenoate hydratase/2-oxohepta-3-ene-1,7-dioic acid hydratase in catechol pathway